MHTHTHTHNRFTALLEYVRDHAGEQVPERKTRKVKTNLDLLEQEIVSGSGICWVAYMQRLLSSTSCKVSPAWRHMGSPHPP